MNVPSPINGQIYQNILENLINGNNKLSKSTIKYDRNTH